MKRAGRLMERVIERDNLRLAFWKAACGKRTKRDAALFAARLDGNLEDLARELDEETYAAGPYHQFTIYDPKQRLITAPCFRDRVVHHAIMNVCEPEFDRFLIDDTFACRRGKGRIAAVERAQHFARRCDFFLKLEIRRYFDSIAHSVLRQRLARRFKDRRLLDLFGRIISGYETAPERGVPIGSLTSQHFANFYLGGLEGIRELETLRARLVSKMGGFVVWGEDRRELRVARDQIGEFLVHDLCLRIEARSIHLPLGRGWIYWAAGCPRAPHSQSSLPDSLCVSTQAIGARAPTRQPWLTRIAVSHDGLGCIHECRSHSELALAQPRARIVAGGRPRPRTGLSGAVAGTTTPGTAARRTATGTRRRTGTTTWASAWPQPSRRGGFRVGLDRPSTCPDRHLIVGRTMTRSAPCW